MIAAVALTLFVAIELTSQKPLLNLRLLVRRNFGFGVLANFLLGVALYGSVFILPVYLSRIQGYNSEQIGMVLAWTGLPQLLLIPLVPQLMKRIDPRIVIGVGFALVRRLQLHEHLYDKRLCGRSAVLAERYPCLWPGSLFAPLSAVATAGIEPENAGSASALFNMTRNLGGAIGIAALQTLLTKREQYHSNVLSQSVSMFEQATRTRLEQLTQYFMNHGVIDRVDAAHRAYVAIGHVVQKQAFILAFSDTFYTLGAALIVALLAGLLLKKPDRLDGGGAH